MRCSEQRPDYQDTGHHTLLGGRWRSGEDDEWMKRAANGLWARENSNLSPGHFLSAQSTEHSRGASFIFQGWRKSVCTHRILAPKLEAVKVKAPKQHEWNVSQICWISITRPSGNWPRGTFAGCRSFCRSESKLTKPSVSSLKLPACDTLLVSRLWAELPRTATGSRFLPKAV